MRILPGVVAYWRDLFPGQSKYVFILGEYGCDIDARRKIAFFTISSQSKWVSVQALRAEMLEIPKGTVQFLDRLSYLQCFHEVQTITMESFRELERQGSINFRGDLTQYLPKVAEILSRSELLSERDILIAQRAMMGDP